MALPAAAWTVLLATTQMQPRPDLPAVLQESYIGVNHHEHLVINGSAIYVNGVQFDLPTILSTLAGLASRLDQVESRANATDALVNEITSSLSAVRDRVDDVNETASSDHRRVMALIDIIHAQISDPPTSSPVTPAPSMSPVSSAPSSSPSQAPSGAFNPVYLGFLRVGNLYQQRDAPAQHNQACSNRWGPRAHQCTRAEAEHLLAEGSQVCGDSGYLIVNDQARWENGYGYYYMCFGSSCPNGNWDTRCNGQPVPCCRNN